MTWPVKARPLAELQAAARLRGNGGAIGAPARVGLAVLDIEPDAAWKRDAACLDVPDREIFFPSRGESNAEAKAIYRSCPVRFECLEYALEHGEKFGVWGGKSERERRRMRRQRRLA